VSANLAITSNYVWRGMTQTANSPAVQGGIDLGYNGFYLGAWGSNVEFGDTNNNLEADFYAGYKTSFSGVEVDLGYILYAYPNDHDALNFDEAYIGLGYDFGMVGINGKYSFAVNSNIDTTDYWEVGGDIELPMEVTLAASYGDYDEVGTNYLVSLSKSWGKFEFLVAYTDFSSDADSIYDEDHFIGTVSTSF
ncbi:MAG: hypothetical protein J7J02_03590, partial [Sulfurovum sp.]|nr:hypothetical protein [Sulfurovum sp.]